MTFFSYFFFPDPNSHSVICQSQAKTSAERPPQRSKKLKDSKPKVSRSFDFRRNDSIFGSVQNNLLPLSKHQYFGLFLRIQGSLLSFSEFSTMIFKMRETNYN